MFYKAQPFTFHTCYSCLIYREESQKEKIPSSTYSAQDMNVKLAGDF